MLVVSITSVGCAAVNEPPVIQTVIQRVEIPVAVPCKEVTPEAPPFKFGELTVEDDIFKKAQTVLSDRQLHIGYEKELNAALEACKK
jgi:hypothetical protein